MKGLGAPATLAFFMIGVPATEAQEIVWCENGTPLVQTEVGITPLQKTYVVLQAGCHPHCKTLGETGGFATHEYGDYFPIRENFPQYAGLKNLTYQCKGDGCAYDDGLVITAQQYYVRGDSMPHLQISGGVWSRSAEVYVEVKGDAFHLDFSCPGSRLMKR